MTEKELISKSLSCIKASDDILAEVYKMAEKNNTTRFSGKRIAVIAVAACLALMLGATAFAAANGVFRADGGMSVAEFFDTAFGKGDSAYEAFDLILKDESGKVVKTEHYPGREDAALDRELAEQLGDYVLAVNKGVTAGDYTLIVRSLVIDENGVGAMTYEISNENGISLDEHGNVLDEAGTTNPVWLFLETADGDMVDTCEYLQKNACTNNTAVYTAYFTPFVVYDGGSLTVHFRWREAGKIQKASEDIPIEAVIGARSLSDGEVSAEVSPLGLLLNVAGDVSIDKMVIRYADGSEYRVIGNDRYNCTVSSKLDTSTAFAFDRLVDTANIVEVIVGGNVCGGSDVPFNYSFR